MEMFSKRTDLAMEAQELWREAAAETTKLPGVKARKEKRDGYPVTRVEILDKQGAKELGKPVGTYLTLDLSTYWQRRPDFFERAVQALGGLLKELLPQEGSALVIGLGNEAMTADAVGPETLRHLLVTRHLIASMPRQFAGFRPVAAMAPGVLGTTGVESAEAVRALIQEVRPDFVLVIDALAARRTGRVCTTVQLSDSGIVPGSGVGNHRWALDRKTLGVPVFALGIPTVVDAATLAADLLEEAGIPEGDCPRFRGRDRGLTVTPRDIDAQVKDLAKVLGYSIDWALQDLEIADINALLS